MKSFTAAAFFVSLAAQAWALTVNTPTSVVQCQPILLSWSDGTAPYFLSILPGGQPSASALKTFDSTSATSLTWTVDIAQGTSITVQIRDSTGTLAYSDAVNIASSSDSSCVSSSVTESGASGSAAGTVAATTGAAATTGGASSASGASSSVSAKASGSVSGTSSPSTTVSKAAGSASTSSFISVTKASSSSSTHSSTSGSAASSTSSSASGAMRGSSVTGAGFAGLLGLVGAALL